MTITHSAHSYALGFTSQLNEITVDSLPVSGVIPDWLQGTLIRNGPGRFEVGNQSFKHWFDGLAMLHRFAIRGGVVSYANRFLRGASYTRAMREGRIVEPGFGTDPCGPLFARLRALFSKDVYDNASVNVARLADRYLAMTETPMPIAFDPDTLETGEVVKYQDWIHGHISTAHPHFDRRRNVMFNYVTRFGRRNTYNVYAVDLATLRQRLIARLDANEPAYMHSFGMSERYIILAEYPFGVSAARLFLSDKPFIANYRWDPSRPTRFHVIDKQTCALYGTYETDPFFCFHHINAFEEGGELFVDLVAYDDATIVTAFLLDNVEAGREPRVYPKQTRRYRLPLAGTRVEHETLGDAQLELPRFNDEAKGGRRHRYVYGTGPTAGGGEGIIKLDADRREAVVWREPGCYPGEPVFVAAPDAASEDDGVVLSVVLDANAGCSFLVVLDGQTMDERARAVAPQHIPFGFHGQFFR
ncbi:MAG: carotenoid oxygenase family protein [Dehalococcoidia bacterium]|nr:carotenoid oxygenase family protein [Dehalococcoidia bacterium]